MFLFTHFFIFKKTYKINLITALILFLFCTLKLYGQTENYDNIQVYGLKKQDKQSILNDEYKITFYDKTNNEILNEIKQVPNVNINTSPSQPSYVNINGLKTNHTLVLINDLPIFDQTSPNAVTNFNNLGVTNFNSVTIYKGSQSGSYGNSAIGGVVNLQTNVYQKGKKVNVNTNYGSNNTFYSNAKAKANYKDLYTYSALSFKNTQGYNIATQGNEKDPFQGQDALFNIAYDINESNNIEVFSLARQYSSSYDDWDYINNQGLDCTSCKSDTLSNFNYIKLNQNYNNYNGYVAVFNTLNKSSYESDYPTYNIDANTLSFKYKGELNYYNFATKLGFENHSTTQTEYENNMEYYTVFVGQELKTTKLLTSFDLSYTNSNYAVKDFIAYSFKSAYFVNKSNTSSLYFNAGKSFRMPSINELITPFGGNKNLLTETAKGANVGFKSQIAKNSYLQTSLFYNKVADQIIYSQGMYKNINGDYIAKGFDTLLHTKPLSFASFTFSYAFTDAKDESSLDKNVHYIPKHTFSLATELNYKYFVANVLLFYNSKTYDTINKASLNPYFDTYASLSYKNPANYFSYYLQVSNALNNRQEVVYGYNNIGREITLGIMASF